MCVCMYETLDVYICRSICCLLKVLYKSVCSSNHCSVCLSPSFHLTQPVRFLVSSPLKKLGYLYFFKKQKQIETGYFRFMQADLIPGQIELITC